MGLTRDQILAGKKGRVEAVKVPSWGGEVWIREMTSKERDAFEAASIDKAGTARMVNIRARLAVISICDDMGTRLFTDGDLTLLGDLPASAMDTIFDAAMRINRISKSDVDELEKNSAAITIAE